MATPIRPTLPLPTPARPSGPGTASEAARAAQRAFFSQALNAAQAADPIAAAPPVQPTMRQAAPETTHRVTLPDQPPERPMRPGSFLDIKI